MLKNIEIKKFRCKDGNGLFTYWRRYNINIKMEDDEVLEIATKPKMNERQLEFVKANVKKLISNLENNICNIK